MRLMMLVMLIAAPFAVLSQKYVLYSVGRPMEMTYNNAQNIVAKKWQLRFEYSSVSMSNADSAQRIGQHNATESARIAAKKGADWRTVFNQAVNAEVTLLKQLSGKVLEHYAAEGESEVMVHFEQTCSKKYKAFVFRSLAAENSRGNAYFIVATYKVNSAKKTVKLVNKTQRLIDFSYPQNDIVN